MHIQAPQGPPPAVPPAVPPAAVLQDGAPADVGSGFVDAMQHLGWVDVTALAVIGVFCVLGLFKGFLWQTSRVAILAAAYAAAASLGQGLADTLVHWTHSSPQPPSADQRETAYYIACVLIFLGVLIALSLLALLLQNLVKKAGLGFYDRLGGGAVGVATGGLVVVFLMALLLMFFPRSHVAQAADASHSLRLSQKAVAALGDLLPVELRRLFGTSPPARGTEVRRKSQFGADPDPKDGNGAVPNAKDPDHKDPAATTPGVKSPGTKAADAKAPDAKGGEGKGPSTKPPGTAGADGKAPLLPTEPRAPRRDR